MPTESPPEKTDDKDRPTSKQPVVPPEEKKGSGEITDRVDVGQPAKPDIHAKQRLAMVPEGVLGLFPADSQNPILYSTRQSTVIGRAAELQPSPVIDLTPYNAVDLGVSRRHAALSFSGSDYTVEDMGSMNGTWLNEMRLPLNIQRPLRSGDILRLGQLVIAVYFHSVSDHPVPVPAEPRKRDADTSIYATIVPVIGAQDLIFAVDGTVVARDQKLTTAFLLSTLIPYLGALEQLQKAIDDMKGRAKRILVILHIRSLPRIVVTAAGADDAAALARTVIARWRKQHTSTLLAIMSANAAGTPPVLNKEKLAEMDVSQAELVANIVAEAGDKLPKSELSDYARQLSGPVKLLATSPIFLEGKDTAGMPG